MFVPVSNTPRDYAWGASGEISALLGYPDTGHTEAELWLGAHHGSPSVLAPESAVTAGATTLDAALAANPGWLGNDSDGRLPFLLKVLSASTPLSLQAHPTTEQAREGFAEENLRGIPLDAPHRNYKDEHHKPELILAVSDRFDALCGFRPVSRTRAALAFLADSAKEAHASVIADFAARLDGEPATVLAEVVSWLLGGGAAVSDLVHSLVSVSNELVRDPALLERLRDEVSEVARTVAETAAHYPGDPGVALAAILNRVSLRQGQALYLPAGNIHAYLGGLGIEVMASSDNVLRGGLTPKHIDVPELISVLDFSESPVPYLEPTRLAKGVRVFRPDVPDFQLIALELADPSPSATLDASFAGPAIALCTAGEAVIEGALGTATVVRGDAVFITPDEFPVTVSGTSTVFVASPNSAAAR